MSVKVQLGGMALRNGVLVHSPRCWACAVRTPDGALRVVSERKTVRSADVRSTLLRAPARVAEVLAVLPALRRRLPEAELPFLERRVLAVMAATGAAVRALRSARLRPGVEEILAALLAVVPALAALRGTALAAYHGAEHIAIGSYEHGEPRPREHERCGSHMVGPLLAATAIGNTLVGSLASTRQGRFLGRAGVAAGSLAVAGELLAWMLRHPDHPLARALAWPGRELQARFLTAEPTSEQLEVAQAALRACVRCELEHEGAAEGRSSAGG